MELKKDETAIDEEEHFQDIEKALNFNTISINDNFIVSNLLY
jgi:hypothetical protein